MSIKETYINNKIGIFDELPDFYTAFAWTDAYYGDESSLHTLYQCIGKPARRINYDIDIVQDFDEAVTSLANQIENGLDPVERNINDTVPKDSGVSIYNFIQNIKERNNA